MRPRCATFAALVVGLGSFSFDRLAKAERIAVITASPASSEAARYLDEQLDHPPAHRESQNARNLPALRREARKEWRADLVIVLDAERATVSVLRPVDGVESSRTLAEEAANEPYVAALAAVELLGIVRSTPLQRAMFRDAPEPPPSSTPAPAPLDTGVTVPPAPARKWLGLELGVLQATGSNGDISLLQPTAAIDAVVVRPTARSWVSLGARASGLSSLRRDQALLLPAGVDSRGTVEYSRNELSARGSAGVGSGAFAGLLTIDIGLAFKELRARNAAERVLTEYTERAFWLGGGGELRYAVVGDLHIGAGLGVAWFPTATAFRGGQEGAAAVTGLSESHLDLRARATLFWEVL